MEKIGQSEIAVHEWIGLVKDKTVLEAGCGKAPFSMAISGISKKVIAICIAVLFCFAMISPTGCSEKAGSDMIIDGSTTVYPVLDMVSTVYSKKKISTSYCGQRAARRESGPLLMVSVILPCLPLRFRHRSWKRLNRNRSI